METHVKILIQGPKSPKRSGSDIAMKSQVLIKGLFFFFKKKPNSLFGDTYIAYLH